MKNNNRFGIYTTFYNCEKYVDRIFSIIEGLNYDNFEWHITDDFSTDETKSVLFNRFLNSSMQDKIKYYEQTEKKQMYWKPNLFFDETFDWIVLIDADDIVDSNFLIIYDKFINKNNKLSLISSDFHKINENDNSLHSINYLLNDDIISKKIKRYHPIIDYTNNLSYSCFGHLRAFKRSLIDEFKITDMLACAEDSYHVFWSNSYGQYLHIPRPLYMWYLRDNSESHNKNIPENFNANFDIALNKLNESDYGVDKLFNDIYVETCSLGSYDISKLKGKNVSLWTRYLSESQENLLKDLYFDSDLQFNNYESEIHIFCLNYFNEIKLRQILSQITNKKFLFYYQNQNYHNNNDELFEESRSQINKFSKIISDFTPHGWWMYFRHLVIKN